MKIYIETDHLILREVTLDDAQGFFELDSDPEVHKYLGNNPISDIEQSKEIIKTIRKQYAENGIARWAVIEKESNEFVGWSGLKLETTLIKDFKYYDLGYRLKRKFWGKGYATESATAALKYGFEELNLTKVCAAAHVENIASNKVLQKVGLVITKTIDLDGDPHNWYSIESNDKI